MGAARDGDLKRFIIMISNKSIGKSVSNFPVAAAVAFIFCDKFSYFVHTRDVEVRQYICRF